MDNEKEVREYIFNEMSDLIDIINNELTDGDEKFKHRFPFYELKKDLDDFLEGYVENRAIILPGLRGIGKSTLILQLCDYLVNEKNVDFRRILYLDASELADYLNTGIYETITYFITEIHHETLRNMEKPIFIFIDEAQSDLKWAKAGKLLYDKIKNDKLFIVFTGSSALNIETTADLSRRAKKIQICPMDFGEYLYLNHGMQIPSSTKNALEDLIFEGDIDEALKIEEEILLDGLKYLKKPIEKEWEHYLLYGELPYGIGKTDIDMKKFNFQLINKILETDLDYIKSYTQQTKNIARRLLSYMALQKPGTLSQNKMASYLDSSAGTINSILFTLEKTHLIFHVEPYGSSGSRTKKSWEYYFLSANIKYAIISKLGNVNRNHRECLGILAENLVASRLAIYKIKSGRDFQLFFPPESEGVDFIINTLDGKVIPIEVGIGKKSKRQIKKAIKKYKTDYGIIISNTTNGIKKEDDVIYLPLSTFSLM